MPPTGGNVVAPAPCGVAAPAKACLLRLSRSDHAGRAGLAAAFAELKYTAMASRRRLAPELLQAAVLRRGRLALLLRRFEGDLHARVLRAPGGALPAATLRAVAQQTADLVRRLASLGLFNSDIKPGNVVVNLAGGTPVVRLIDFDPLFMSHLDLDADLLWVLPGKSHGHIMALYALAMLELLRLHVRRAGGPNAEPLRALLAEEVRRFSAQVVPSASALRAVQRRSRLLLLLADRLRHYRLLDGASEEPFWAELRSLTAPKGGDAALPDHFRELQSDVVDPSLRPALPDALMQAQIDQMLQKT
jgi:hypothetical protein